MASNFTKRLDRLERLIRERTQASTHPLYLRDGDIPEGIDPARVVVIRREYVDPPAREEDALPEAQPLGDLFGAESKRPAPPIIYPNLGLV